MTRSPSQSVVLIILLCLALNVKLVLSFGFSSTVKEATPGTRLANGPETDLTNLLRTSPDEHAEVYSNAIHLLDSLQTAPSCSRLAAFTLISSCQSVEGAAQKSEKTMEDLKSVYAAQLAICEIMDAGSNIPGNCKSVEPKQHGASGKGFGTSGKTKHGRDNVISSIPKSHLIPCLQSLESRPQHWTSYSNNRQNAVVMCQAARINIEKDEMIKLQKEMVGTTAGANSALSKAVAAANEALVQQEGFLQAIQALQKRLSQDLERASSETQSYLQLWTNKVKDVLDNIAETFTARLSGAEKDVDKLSKSVLSSVAETKALRSNIGKIFQQAVEGSSGLAATQAKHWDANQVSALELQNLLQKLGKEDIQSLFGAFGSFHEQLKISNELAATMYERQSSLDERLEKLDESFASLESAAETLRATQTADAKAQIEHNNRIQVELQVFHGLLSDIISSAATLQTTVQDTSSKIATFAAFGGLSTIVLDWGWSLILILVLHQLNPQCARFVVAALGVFILFSAYGLPSFIKQLGTISIRQSYQEYSMPPLAPVIVGSGILLGLAIAARSSIFLISFLKAPQPHVRSVLPFGGHWRSDSVPLQL